MRVFRSAAVTSFGRENRAARICVALELLVPVGVVTCAMRSALYPRKWKIEGAFFTCVPRALDKFLVAWLRGLC